MWWPAAAAHHRLPCGGLRLYFATTRVWGGAGCLTRSHTMPSRKLALAAPTATSSVWCPGHHFMWSACPAVLYVLNLSSLIFSICTLIPSVLVPLHGSCTAALPYCWFFCGSLEQLVLRDIHTGLLMTMTPSWYTCEGATSLHLFTRSYWQRTCYAGPSP